MKKIIVLVFFLIFRLFPAVPSVFADEGQNPDKNIKVRGWEQIAGKLGLIDFEHDMEHMDAGAPQLSTLVEGEAMPAIMSLYQVYEWDWINNRRDGLYPPPPDAPADFATLVGFAAAGKTILVPDSGYDIGGGYETLVLYADENSITLQYTLDDSVAGPGYTIHLINFQVDSQLLAYYNKLDQEGRKRLPALMSGMRIGQGTGELIASIRDTGSFLDPRWSYDWWARRTPASGRELVPGSSDALPGGSPGSPWTGPGGLGCQPRAGEEKMSSRPYPCVACSLSTFLGKNCGTPMAVSEKMTFKKNEGRFCEDEGWVVDKTWGGTINVDASQTVLPIAGITFDKAKILYGNTIDKDFKQRVQENFLADYFEGTLYYDMKDPGTELEKLKPDNPENVKKAFGIGQEMLSEAGVFRLLAPLEYQDKLKREMIQKNVQWKASGSPVYTVKLDGVGEAKLTEYADDPQNRMKPTDPAKVGAWEQTMWGKLWKAIPMFPRNDLLGGFTLVPQNNPSYPKATIKPAENKTGKLRFPHLARLDAITLALQNMLVLNYQGENKIKLAAAGVQGIETETEIETEMEMGQALAQTGFEKIISPINDNGIRLAAAGECFHLEATSVLRPDGKVDVTVYIVFTGGDGHIQFFVNGVDALGWHPGWNINWGPYEVIPLYTGSPLPVPGSVTYSVKVDECGGKGLPNEEGLTCNFSLDASGKLISNCGPRVPPPPPCGTVPLPTVAPCDKTAARGAGDTMCGAMDNAFYLKVEPDTVKFPEHISCNEVEYPGGWSLDGRSDPCYGEVDKTVSRGVEVKISIPLIDKIWGQMAATNGLFNIFKIRERERIDPKTGKKVKVDQFGDIVKEDQPAETDVNYSFTADPPGWGSSVSPTGGKLKISHLGALKQLKDLITGQILMPQ